MTQRLPRKSAKNTAQALRILAVGKYLTDLIKTSTAGAKLYLLEKEMNPKDRRSVTLDDDTDIGTVSMSAGKAGTPKVVDPIAFAAWLDERGIYHGGKPSVEFPKGFVSKDSLEGLLKQHEGEIPDGLELQDDGDPYLVVNQSVDQKIALRDAIDTAQAADLLAEVAPLQIEGKTK